MKTTAASVALLIALLVPGSAGAQTPGPDAGSGIRIGVAVGGISTVSLNFEIFRDSHAVDFGLGTWSFRDVSFSATYKEYLGAGSARPVVGAGLWLVGARGRGDERTGLALILRVPIGVDWEFRDPHALGFALNVDRALWVHRSDPDDDRPLNRRLVPLPEIYYRYAR